VVQLNIRADTPVTTPQGEPTTAAAWADALGIAYTPSLLFYDAQGAEVFRVEAFLWSFHLQSALDYVASGAYRGQPNFQRFLRDRREQMREQGLDVGLED
jgi:thioredoxin-related protein